MLKILEMEEEEVGILIGIFFPLSLFFSKGRGFHISEFLEKLDVSRFF